VSNRPKAWAVALLAVVFIAGAAVGWGLRAWAAGAPTPHHRDPRAIVADLAKRVGLAPAQRESVRAVLERHRAEMDSLWRAVRPRLDSIRTVMQAEISAQLTPAQQERFRDLVARHERQRHAADSANQERWGSDHVGVLNGAGKCPTTPPGAPVDATGCPVHPDRDGVK
jgi:heavy-metal resistance protein